MANRKKMTAEQILELDVKAMLRGAMHRFGGCLEFGQQYADLCCKETEGGMPTAVPDSIRMAGMKTLAALLGQHGDGGASSTLVDDEALEARLAQLEATRPPEELEPYYDDDPDAE